MEKPYVLTNWVQSHFCGIFHATGDDLRIQSNLVGSLPEIYHKSISSG